MILVGVLLFSCCVSSEGNSNNSEVATTTPAPLPDYDGDGVPDIDDLCPVIYGDASCHGCPDVSFAQYGPAQSQYPTVFFTGFEQLDDDFILFGNPRPRLNSYVGAPEPCFDNNGDENYYSGAIGKYPVQIDGTVAIAVDMLVTSDMDGCWMEASFGITPFTTYGDTIWPGYGVGMEYKYCGAACQSASGGTLSLISDGKVAYYEEGLDAYLDSWHQFLIVIGSYYAVYYIDGEPIFSSPHHLNPDYDHYLLLGQRSGDYANVYHDNLAVYLLD